MTEDDLAAPAILHACLTKPIGTAHPPPPHGALAEMIGLALLLPEEDRLSARIMLESGVSIGWTQIAEIAASSGMG